jgi:hypothetical protein
VDLTPEATASTAGFPPLREAGVQRRTGCAILRSVHHLCVIIIDERVG